MAKAPDGDDLIPLSRVNEIVQAALADNRQAMLAAVSEQIASAKAGGLQPPADGDWSSALAMAIAQLTDQGTGRKRVAPEALAAREVACQRMLDLIHQAADEGKVPEYRILAPVYLNEVLHDPMWRTKRGKLEPTVIGWTGVPSEAMAPENDVARQIFDAFCAWIGAVGPRDQGKIKVTPKGRVVYEQAPSDPELEAAAAAARKARGAPGAGRSQVPVGTVSVRTGPTPDVMIGKPVSILGSLHPPAMERNH